MVPYKYRKALLSEPVSYRLRLLVYIKRSFSLGRICVSTWDLTLTGVAQEKSKWTFSRTWLNRWAGISGYMILKDIRTHQCNLLLINGLCSIPVFGSTATQPRELRAITSAPLGWILERGPVDPRPLKLGI